MVEVDSKNDSQIYGLSTHFRTFKHKSSRKQTNTRMRTSHTYPHHLLSHHFYDCHHIHLTKAIISYGCYHTNQRRTSFLDFSYANVYASISLYHFCFVFFFFCLLFCFLFFYFDFFFFCFFVLFFVCLLYF